MRALSLFFAPACLWATARLFRATARCERSTDPDGTASERTVQPRATAAAAPRLRAESLPASPARRAAPAPAGIVSSIASGSR